MDIITLNNNDIIINFAKKYIDNLLNIVFYSPKLLQKDFHLIKLDKSNYNNNEICMLCQEYLDIEIINYKCKSCSCHLHHNCVNLYLSNNIIFNCMQCKIDYKRFKKFSGISIYFEWENSIISNINICNSQCNTYMLISFIDYKHKNTNKKMRDYQICIYRDKVLYKLIILESNDNIEYVDNISYIAYIYINDIIDTKLSLVKSIDNITIINPILFL
jgi:hypothetical protein